MQLSEYVKVNATKIGILLHLKYFHFIFVYCPPETTKSKLLGK